ncbi:MAG: zinc-binding dehydrogenase [Caldilineaceae bacterium]
MKQLVTVGPRQGEVIEVAAPVVQEDQILLKTRAVSVLMENVGLHTGADPRLKAPGNPLYRGYPIAQAGEVLGEVVEVGAAVQGVAVGERFVSYANFNEYHAVAPTAWTRIAANVADTAAISAPFSGTALHCIRRAKITVGDDVAIIGQGPMGLLVTQWARFAGAGRVIVADLNPKRLAVAQQMGATHTINAATEHVKEMLYAITENRGPDLVIDAGNTATTFPLAMDLARVQGRIVVISWHTQPITIDDITRDFYHKELEIIATRATGPSHSYRSPYQRWTGWESQQLIARLMAEGRFDPSPLITDQLLFGQFQEALRRVEQAQDQTVKALVTWD